MFAQKFAGTGLISLLMGLALTAGAQQKPQLTDPEIASVAVTANQVDIAYARIALQKSHNPDIRNFAETMQRDHQSVIKQATSLVQKLHVTPKDNEVSRSLRNQEQKTSQELRSKTGHAFDQAYISNEVAYHQAVIQTVEDVLIPEAQNADLKGLLQQVLPILKEHLQHAQSIAEKLGAGTN
ncbi:putative membrane protein [Thermoflavifilum aggregans]|uniref:Putative membrane protein n=1 Tax=Thermoflavifilum aggregans TaxID=454188 RepID=A0A2M9CRF3_9BACT|nr:DUF4142 domain-containing protein [Thermoflavifilum aggregans]PJJ74516.1 putative membrane protein [Thermoflavifilum aggregans]